MTEEPAATPQQARAGGDDARRAARRLFVAVVAATWGAYATLTMAPVIAHDITGSAFLAGLPVAVLLAGAGAGATRVMGLVRRRGPRIALSAATLVGAAGCLLTVAAVTVSSFPLLLVGVLGVGVGMAGNQLSRYVAAERYPVERRAAVIGWMVWALAVGAVLGPLSLGPAGEVLAWTGAPAEVAGSIIGVVLFGVAAVVHITGTRRAPAPAASATSTSPDAASVWSQPIVHIAIAAMVTSLVVMLLVMTVTPLHVHDAGHGVATVGGIMSAHTLGMFALSPVAGKLTERFGSVPVILLGLATLLVATGMGAATPAGSRLLLGVALWALGFGWCLAFIAASALIAGLDESARVSLQGQAEAITWLTGAVAAASAGFLLGFIHFPGLNLVAASLLSVPLAVILVHRRSALHTAGAR
jgi:MFS family permease